MHTFLTLKVRQAFSNMEVVTCSDECLLEHHTLYSPENVQGIAKEVDKFK